MWDGRLLNALGGLSGSVIMMAIFFIIAISVKLLSKKSIGTQKYYSIAVVLGALLYILSPYLASTLKSSVISKAPPTGTTPTKQGSQTSSKLDSPFIAPDQKNLEKFPSQLQLAVQQLTKSERAELTEALSFLNFSLTIYWMKNQPDKFKAMSENDLKSKELVKLYSFARKQGETMTLRKYIRFADSSKKSNPDYWDKYRSFNGEVLSGLDAPFIAPPNIGLDEFIKKEKAARQQLSPDEKKLYDESIRLITISFSQHLKDKNPVEYKQLSQTSFDDKMNNALFMYAQRFGFEMTLRKYVEKAEAYK